MTATEWTIAVGNDMTRAIYEPATTGADDTVFVCAHGAGGNMNDRSVLATAKAMHANGLGVVRFNFLYKEKGSGRPDAMPKLTATLDAVVQQTRATVQPRRLIIGGRSMGGRAASMLASEGYAADGLLLLAYPLHPPGQPEKIRDAHLPNIQMPVLAISGTRDPFATRDLMERAFASIPAPCTLHWIDGAEHSFHVLKSSGRTDAQVMDEIGRLSGAWAAALP